MRDETTSCFSGTRIAGGSSGCISTSRQRRCGRIRDELRRKTRQTWLSLDRDDRRPQPVHPGRPALFPSRPPTDAESSRSLRRISASRAGGPANTGIAGRHGRSCPGMRSGAITGWSGGTSRRRFVQLIQGLHGERRGKPYAGNPHVRFDEGPLARACRTAGWGLLHHCQDFRPETCCSANRSTARENASPGRGHSAGQVRDLAWTRPSEAFPDCRPVATLARFAAAASFPPMHTNRK